MRRLAIAAVAFALLLTGIAPAHAAPVAPRPVVSGNILIDSVTGAAWVPRGVNFPSFEYACAQGWGYSRESANAATAAAIAAWNANVVRVPLNQDCWLGTNGAPAGVGRTAAGYRAAVAAFVGQLNAAGLAVILDLHSWRTKPDGNIVGQRAMPDSASLTFWSSVATTFASNPSVIFDAFNEPYSRWNSATGSWAFQLTWDCWKNGGCRAPLVDDYTPLPAGYTNPPATNQSYPVVGMDAIVAAIRAAGASQPILVAGLDYSNDLGQWLTYRPNDTQLIAGFHNYAGQACHTVTCWNTKIAPVAAVVPVITGEFADDGDGSYMEGYMDWADAHSIGYLPWAWWVLSGAAGEYALLDNDDGTPRSPMGTTLKSHLAALVPDPCPDRTVPRVSSWSWSGPVCLAGGGEALRSVIGLSGTATGRVPED